MTALQQTCLFDRHVALGARLAPFAGFKMPIQYSGIVKEHRACREAAVVFDTCHMGEIEISGPQALDGLERLVSCRVSSLAPGQCRYGMMCNEAGGVIDDLLVYRLDDAAAMLVVNAATRMKDVGWIQENLDGYRCRVEDVSEKTAKLDLQGPGAPRVLLHLLEEPPPPLKYYRFTRCRYRGAPILLSRTGYTGEIGFEIYAEADVLCRAWDACLEAGAIPAGLGARDTLRLEMGMPLYGHELNEDRNAAETGSRALDAEKRYIGSDAVCHAPRRRLTGLLLEGKRAVRAGAAVYDGNNRPCGVVTSGSYAPSLDRAVALAYVDRETAQPGETLQADGARTRERATTAALPFYRSGTARRALGQFLP